MLYCIHKLHQLKVIIDVYEKIIIQARVQKTINCLPCELMNASNDPLILRWNKSQKQILSRNLILSEFRL